MVVTMDSDRQKFLSVFIFEYCMNNTVDGTYVSSVIKQNRNKVSPTQTGFLTKKTSHAFSAHSKQTNINFIHSIEKMRW